MAQEIAIEVFSAVTANIVWQIAVCVFRNIKQRRRNRLNAEIDNAIQRYMAKEKPNTKKRNDRQRPKTCGRFSKR